jgi:hypothetical protein
VFSLLFGIFQPLGRHAYQNCLVLQHPYLRVVLIVELKTKIFLLGWKSANINIQQISLKYYIYWLFNTEPQYSSAPLKKKATFIKDTPLL